MQPQLERQEREGSWEFTGQLAWVSFQGDEKKLVLKTKVCGLLGLSVHVDFVYRYTNTLAPPPINSLADNFIFLFTTFFTLPLYFLKSI